MKEIKWFFFSVFVALLFVCQSSFALPFSITPVGTLPTTVDNVSDATAYYTVRNTTTQAAPASFVKFLPPFVKQVVDRTQPSLCGAVFNLAPNASCTLALNISGPVNPRDPNPEHHLFVCRAGGKTCAGTAYELNVTQVTLVSIAVTPTSPTKPVGTTQQFAATGTFSDGSVRSLLGYDVVWSSSDETKATINASTGLATALAVGSTGIRASLGGIVSPAVTFTISAAELTSILITPAPTSSTPLGTTLQFRAIGTFTDGETADITSLSTTDWSSSDETVATIGLHTGLATGVAVSPPTTTIRATSGAIISNPSTLTVTAAVLECITVTPDPGNVAATGTCAPGVAGANCLAFTAMGTYSDGLPPVDITTSVTWASSSPSNASISNAGGACPGSTCKGTALGLIDGTSTYITASLSGITSNNVLLTVSTTLLSIAVTPNPMAIYVGESFQFTATGTYDIGPTVPITDSVGWGSSNPAIASVGNIINPGLATGLTPGVTNILATSDSIVGSASLTVNDQKLYAGLDNTNVCMSSDGASSWPPANCAIPVALRPVLDMAPADGRIYVLVGSGFVNNVCYADNGSVVWTCPGGMSVGVPAAVAALSLTYVYASDFSLGGPEVCVSTNNGVSFNAGCFIVVADLTDSVTSLAVTDITNLYAGMQNGSICKSQDNGSTWLPCVSLTGVTSVNALTVDRSTGYVYAGVTSGANGGVCVSTNAGTTYICNTASFTGDPVLSVAESNGYLYAGTTSGNVCVSINNGLTFTCKPVFGTPTNITSLAIDRYGLVFAGSGAGADTGQVCKSYDHGLTTPWPICHIVNALSPVAALAITQP